MKLAVAVRAFGRLVRAEVRGTASREAAQLSGATVIQVASQFGLPVSTTHVITGSVIGSGAARRISALRWGVGANIVVAWIVTIPASMILEREDGVMAIEHPRRQKMSSSEDARFAGMTVNELEFEFHAFGLE